MVLFYIFDYIKRLIWKSSTPPSVTEPPIEDIDCSCQPLFIDGHPPDLHRALSIFRETERNMAQLRKIFVRTHIGTEPFPGDFTMNMVMSCMSDTCRQAKIYSKIGYDHVERLLRKEPSVWWTHDEWQAMRQAAAE